MYMLKFVGDICFTDNHFDVGFGVGSAIKNGKNPFAKMTKQQSDIWIGNFESVVSDVSIYSDYHKDCFRIDPKYLNHCQFFDYFGVANNHVMEHGPDAYNQMCDYLAGFSQGVFGSDKQRSIEFEHQGHIVSIIGFCLRAEEGKHLPLYWSDPECEDIIIECNKLKSDFKVVYIHWGVEFIDHPSVEQVKFAHWLIDIGYDLVIGVHPHIMQGYEVYKGKYIFYSLGNFVFNMSYEPTKYSCVVNVDVANNRVSYDYIKIDKDYCPILISEQDVPERYRLETLNRKIVKKCNIEEYIREAFIGLKMYRRSHHMAFIQNIHRYNFSIMKSIVIDFIKRRLKYEN